jgi:hypothetical protein
MKTEFWLQIIVGVVIFGSLSFLSVNIFDMKGVLEGVRTKVDITDARVGRIADALPDMKVHLAWEEVYRTMSGFITVTHPKRVSNKWITKAAVYNAERKKIIVYAYVDDKLQIGGYPYFYYDLTGRIMCKDRNAESFSNLQFYSNEIKDPVTIPVLINDSSSYILRKANIKYYDNYLKSIGAKELGSISFKKANNWKELSKSLDELSELIDKIKVSEEEK